MQFHQLDRRWEHLRLRQRLQFSDERRYLFVSGDPAELCLRNQEP